MNRIAIYGAGGFGREIACMIKAINDVKPTWEMAGFFDDGLPKGYRNKYGDVLGGIGDLNTYKDSLAVVISIATPAIIEKLANEIVNPNVYFPNLVAPNVNMFDPETVSIGKGNVIFFGCRISCDVKIGDFNLMNGAVSLGHDVTLGSYNVLGPSCRISGDTVTGNGNFFGVGAIVLQGKKIGDRTRIGANSVVIRNTKDDSLYMGNPAKLVLV